MTGLRLFARSQSANATSKTSPRAAKCLAAFGVALLVASPALPAQAKNLFTAAITVDGNTTVSYGTDKLKDILDNFDESQLQIDFGNYTSVSSVTATANLRGLPFSLGFDSNSNTLTFVVPALDLSISFDGASRDDSKEALEKFLSGDFEGAKNLVQTVSELSEGDATRVLQTVVALSPVDPVAGNPNSLQSRMFRADFDMGTTGPIAHPLASKHPSDEVNLFQAGIEYGSYEVDGYDVTAFHLPFSYAYEFDESDNALIFDFPLSYTSAGSGKSYMGSFGLGYRYRAADWWTLTPALRLGGAGSIDVGGLAAVYSGTVTSHMTHQWGDATFGLGLMAGGAKTIDGIEIGGWDVSYELTNFIGQFNIDVVSGLGFGWKGAPLGWRGYFTAAQFGGDDLYVENSNEVGVEFATLGRNGKLLYQAMSLGLAYTFGDDYTGYTLRGKVRF